MNLCESETFEDMPMEWVSKLVFCQLPCTMMIHHAPYVTTL